MREIFSFVPEAIENTQKIADRCNMTFEFGHTKLPAFEVPDGRDNVEYFESMCKEGLYRRYGENPDPELWERLNYELGVIERMGYVNYYLIVHDFINYAKSVGIPVGPGRGSGAGSICAYCIGITYSVNNSIISSILIHYDIISSKSILIVGIDLKSNPLAFMLRIIISIIADSNDFLLSLISPICMSRLSK
jgi:DNA polymerase III alpha subunit (gram-positive type)